MHIYPQDGSKLLLFFPIGFGIQVQLTILFRKELQYILHSRHKAEIEILSSKQYERSCSREPISSSSAANPGLDITGRDAPHELSYNPASALSDGLTSAHPIPSSSSLKHGTHVLLVQYLSMKVTNCVVLARRRFL